jgi:hypothetical protein
MKYSISIDHKLRIIRYKHTGIIQAAEIEEAWQEFLTMKEFTELKYNLLSDYRNSVFDIPIKFADVIIEFMNAIKHIVNGKKQALIVDDPYSTAISIIFEDMVYQKVGFIVQVFSTEEAALRWLSP